MIAGAVKYFRFSVEYILHDISYTNLVMLSATIPDYGSKDGKSNDKVIKADDPANNALVMKALGY